MRAPLCWLRDFAPFGNDVGALVNTFNALGMVVDGVEQIGGGLDDVSVARVAEIHAIPGADKIRLVLVDTGAGEPVEVVCGAWNFAQGDLVPFVGVGARLPDGMEIARRKMKGVVSNGMICSARELGLGDDHDGILVLPPSVEVGAPFAEAMGITADVVFDLDIETNRPDALSIAGVARDAAAKLGLPFAIPEPPAVPMAAEGPLVRVEAPELCPRFTATVLTGVRVGPSPEWLARRLTLAGMRPINNVVDISNYVMLELGQPTHPYDLARLPGGGLLVRRADPGETLVTLDDVERSLGDGDDCLICDATGVPVGIAGIMGGASSEISEATDTVLLEAAWFERMAIARTSKRLGLRSEASARFERGVDPEGTPRAVARFVELATELASASLGGAVDARDDTHLPPPRAVRLRTERVNAVLGTELSDEQVRGYLAPIGFAATPVGPGEHAVVVPSFRLDVQVGEIDVIEEVARHHGYMQIPRTVPRSPLVGRLTPHQRDRRRVRDVLAGMGVTEAQTGLLLGPGDHDRAGLPEDGIEADRPLGREESVLRTSLLPGLLRAVGFNAAHGRPAARLFEIGHVFRMPATEQPLPDEHERVSVALGGEDAAAAAQVLMVLVDAMRLVGVRLTPTTAAGLHPARTASVHVDGAAVGYVGEVDPDVVAGSGVDGRVGWLDLDLERLLAGPHPPEEARPVSRYPWNDIDLAFVLPDEVAAADVAVTLAAAAGELLVDLSLFDVYRGPSLPDGTRSLAYRLRFQAVDRTLTDDEVQAARQRAIEAAERAHRAQLRG